METINFNEYKLAYDRIKPFIKRTPLLKINNLLFLKRESYQITNSFKWPGVLYAVMKVFDNFIQDPIMNFKLVTQSTGNHGIAMIHAVMVLREHYSKIHPHLTKEINSISPIIFTNKYILKNKFNKMNDKLKSFKNNGFIDLSSKNYQESLNLRKKYIKNHSSVYIAHGNKDIMTGYGAIAFQIDEMLPKNIPINFFCAVGAGGPIGIGLCLKYLRDTNFNIVQTKGFDSFIKSIKNNKIIINSEPKNILVSDGIAVDKPEEYALNIGKKIINKMIVVDEIEVLKLKKKYPYGGSSLISILGYNKIKNDNSRISVILDCEGNDICN